MKNKIIFALVFCLLSFSGNTQTKPPLVNMDTLKDVSLPNRNNTAFKDGEYLRFRLHYGIIDAGEAELTVKKIDQKIQGREVYHIVGTGKSLGAFSWFFKVEDKYETYLDVKGIFPWIFLRDINEGGYKKQQHYTFFQNKNAVKTNKGEVYKVKPSVQDMLSSFYYARTFDFSNSKPGDIFTIPTFVDGEEFPLKIKLVKRESIKIRMGEFQCLKFVPVVQKGRIFKEEEDLQVWITDDANKIPLLAKASVLVGSIKMEVVEYKNLSSPIARID